MKILKILSTLLLALGFSGCGEDGGQSGLTDKEFKQDIRYISYLLKNARVDLHLESPNGSVENSNKEMTFAPDEAKDKVERVIDGPDFILKVNGEKAAIKISSVGNVEHTTTVQSGNSACSLFGTSSITGRALALQVQLEWVLNVEIQGDKCEDQVRADFSNFVNKEIDSLHFQSVKDLLGAADRQFSSAKRLQIRLSLNGEGR